MIFRSIKNRVSFKITPAFKRIPCITRKAYLSEEILFQPQIFAKGGIMSENTACFLLLQNKYVFQITMQKIWISFFSVMAGNSNFLLRIEIWKFFFGEVKIFQYLLTLSHLYTGPGVWFLFFTIQFLNSAGAVAEFVTLL